MVSGPTWYLISFNAWARSYPFTAMITRIGGPVVILRGDDGETVIDTVYSHALLLQTVLSRSRCHDTESGSQLFRDPWSKEDPHGPQTDQSHFFIGFIILFSLRCDSLYRRPHPCADLCKFYVYFIIRIFGCQSFKEPPGRVQILFLFC